MTRDAWLYGGWTLQAGLLVHFAAAAPGPITHVVFGDSSGAAMVLPVSTCSLPASISYTRYCADMHSTDEQQWLKYTLALCTCLGCDIWSNLHLHSSKGADDRAAA